MTVNQNSFVATLIKFKLANRMNSSDSIQFSRTRILLAAFAALMMLSAAGCYQRTIAPELSYDKSNVETLDKEIKKIDWEL